MAGRLAFWLLIAVLDLAVLYAVYVGLTGLVEALS